MIAPGVLKELDTLTSIIVHVTVFAAAIAGAYKFQLLRLLSHRHKSHVESHHYVLAKDQIVFVAEYTVSNIGERPIDFTGVSLRLCGAKSSAGLLEANQSACLAERIMDRNGETDTLFHIAAGERSIFTLRTILPKLDPVVFVLCQLKWAVKKAQPAPFVHMHVRSDEAPQQFKEKKAVAGR
jgi:hypothetical protein